MTEGWHHTESPVKPESVDTTSSKVYVLVRKDIKETTDSEGNTIYEYEEKFVSKEDWTTYSDIILQNQIIEQNSSDITSTMDGLVETYETVNNNTSDINICMSAIAELYDLINK